VDNAADLRAGLEIALAIRDLKRQGLGGTAYYREQFSYRVSNRTHEETIRLAQQGPAKG
jgi:hypothetical protein